MNEEEELRLSLEATKSENSSPPSLNEIKDRYKHMMNPSSSCYGNFSSREKIYCIQRTPGRQDGPARLASWRKMTQPGEFF
jgi:hypothetical protein